MYPLPPQQLAEFPDFLCYTVIISHSIVHSWLVNNGKSGISPTQCKSKPRSNGHKSIFQTSVYTARENQVLHLLRMVLKPLHYPIFPNFIMCLLFPTPAWDAKKGCQKFSLTTGWKCMEGRFQGPTPCTHIIQFHSGCKLHEMLFVCLWSNNSLGLWQQILFPLF